MKRKIFLTGTVLILAMAMTAAGADVAGKWIAEQQSPQGTQEITFNFTVNGEALTGTVSGGRGGDGEISDGKIEGDDISFAVVRTVNENEVRTTYRGKVSGDEIRFTVEGGRGGGMGKPAGGKPAGGGMGKPAGGGTQELIAKRAQ